MPITAVGLHAPRSIAGVSSPGTASPGGDASGFAQALNALIDGVENTTKTANEAVSAMLDKTGDVHDAMIALHEAETSLEFTVQVRNKLVQAYQDIMRMPI
jgi:flagellar hook-basal body complex protein FliE